MTQTQLVIAEPHAEAIQQRMMLMKAVEAQLNTMLQEDRRHVDAILRTAGLDPFRYAQYQLRRDEAGQWVLDLTPKPQAAPAPATEPSHVNGSPKPELAPVPEVN